MDRVYIVRVRNYTIARKRVRIQFQRTAEYPGMEEMLYEEYKQLRTTTWFNANNVWILRISSLLFTLKNFAEFRHPNSFVYVMTTNNTFPTIIPNSHSLNSGC